MKGDSLIELIRLPEERKAVAIGKNAAVKKQIEKLTETEITIDDDVRIQGEPVGVMDAKNIITAIGRGFSPDTAMKLSDGNKSLEVISLNEYGPKKKITQKARIIGTKGRTRKLIEQFTGCDVSVYGNTVSIIGDWESVDLARQAIMRLLTGKSHSTVYKFLEKNFKPKGTLP
ncbi:MAG: RNA-processing protein [Candidatus Aenigmarchaeota archaeon]|nr:RNA-processing protein [Candidatus Aenigmarchaeota archaeon]